MSIKQRLDALERLLVQQRHTDQPVRAWFLTFAEYAQYQKTGALPPERTTQPPPPLVLVFSDTVKPVTVLDMDINEL